MKILSAVILSAALVAGAAGSALAYRHASDPGPVAVATAAAEPRPAAQVVRPGTRFRWAPCPAGSRLEKAVCVTDVVRTVVIPAPAAPVVAAPAASAAGAAPAPAPPVTEDDDGEDEDYEDEDHEDEDDDGEDEDHEDEDDD